MASPPKSCATARSNDLLASALLENVSSRRPSGMHVSDGGVQAATAIGHRGTVCAHPCMSVSVSGKLVRKRVRGYGHAPPWPLAHKSWQSIANNSSASVCSSDPGITRPPRSSCVSSATPPPCTKRSRSAAFRCRKICSVVSAAAVQPISGASRPVRTCTPVCDGPLEDAAQSLPATRRVVTAVGGARCLGCTQCTGGPTYTTQSVGGATPLMGTWKTAGPAPLPRPRA